MVSGRFLLAGRIDIHRLLSDIREGIGDDIQDISPAGAEHYIPVIKFRETTIRLWPTGYFTLWGARSEEHAAKILTLLHELLTHYVIK